MIPGQCCAEIPTGPFILMSDRFTYIESPIATIRAIHMIVWTKDLMAP